MPSTRPLRAVSHPRPLPPTSPFLRRGPALTLPWPLLPVALADVSYAVYAYVVGASSVLLSLPPVSSSSWSGATASAHGSPSTINIPTHPPSSDGTPAHPPTATNAATLAAAVPPLFLALAFLRASTLGGLMGTRRWRQRGGWVLALTGATLIACVWEVCVGRLSRGREVPGRKRREVEGLFLLVTASIAVFEFLFFLLLVRLSPPRAPFALRPPPGRASSLPLTPHVTPLPTSRRDGHRDRPPLPPLFTTPIPTEAGAAVVSPLDVAPGTAASYGATDSVATSLTSFGGPATMRSPNGWEWSAPDERDEDRRSRVSSHRRWPSASASEAGTDPAYPYDDSALSGFDNFDPEAGVEDGYESDDSASRQHSDSDTETASTVSESSIIDLPRPRPLHPIVLPDSTSMGALAEIAGAVEAAAGVVRRSASARFGRSAEAEGYGTFSGRV